MDCITLHNMIIGQAAKALSNQSLKPAKTRRNQSWSLSKPSLRNQSQGHAKNLRNQNQVPAKNPWSHIQEVSVFLLPVEVYFQLCAHLSFTWLLDNTLCCRLWMAHSSINIRDGLGGLFLNIGLPNLWHVQVPVAYNLGIYY
jgi:hypothetical protein